MYIIAMTAKERKTIHFIDGVSVTRTNFTPRAILHNILIILRYDTADLAFVIAYGGHFKSLLGNKMRLENLCSVFAFVWSIRNRQHIISRPCVLYNPYLHKTHELLYNTCRGVEAVFFIIQSAIGKQ